MLAVGRTKIPYGQLFLLNRSELNTLIEGHEIDLREQWEMTRRQSLFIRQSWVKEILDKKHFPLLWDEEIEKPIMTNDEKDHGKKLLEISKKLKNGKSENRG